MINLLNSLWQGTALTALIWLMLKLLPRLSSATRYGIWWITLLATVLLSLQTILPAGNSEALRAPVPTISDKQVALIPVSPHAPENYALILRSSPGPQVPQLMEYSPSPRLHPLILPAHLITRLILAAWLILSVSLMLRLAYSYQALRRLKQTAIEPSESLRSRFTRIAAGARTCRSAHLLVSHEITSPLALGFVNPAILIPSSLADESQAEEFNHIVLHELAHLSRYDDWANLFQQFLITILPIQPALFWIGRQLNLEREAACDDRVIAVAASPRSYANSLARMAELALWARHGSLACPALATGIARSRSQLYRRIHRLLDHRSNKTPGISAIPLLMAIMVVAFLFSLSIGAPQLIALTDAPASPQTPASNTATTISNAKEAPMPTTILPSIPGTQIQSIPAQPSGKIVVDLDLGNVQINSWEKNEVQIKITQNGPDIQKFLHHHQITLGRQDRQIALRSTSDGSATGVRVDVEYRITVPSKFDVQLTNQAGDATLSGLNGTLSTEISDGNIDATSCAGALDTSAHTGNITLHTITAATHAVTTDGNVEAAECQGPLYLSSTDGNIDLAKNTGDVKATTIDGNFVSSAASGTIDASARAGNIDIRKFTGSALNAHTNMGNVSADIDGTLKSDSSLTADLGNVDLNLIASAAVRLKIGVTLGNVNSEIPAGSVNGGGPELAVTSRMGNVNIHKK